VEELPTGIALTWHARYRQPAATVIAQYFMQQPERPISPLTQLGTAHLPHHVVFTVGEAGSDPTHLSSATHIHMHRFSQWIGICIGRTASFYAMT
jgi:hypothetical protein